MPASKRQQPIIVLYTRAGCHLCEPVESTLRQAERQGRITLRVEDVDGNPVMQEKYGQQVPVVEVDGRPRMWGRINQVLLRRLISVN